VLRMLDERRTHLTRQRTPSVNQLHALLRELLLRRRPPADRAAATLARVRPSSPAERARKAAVSWSSATAARVRPSR
jgi:transposase